MRQSGFSTWKKKDKNDALSVVSKSGAANGEAAAPGLAATQAPTMVVAAASAIAPALHNQHRSSRAFLFA